LITKHAVFSCASKSSALVDGLSQINPIAVHVFVQSSIQNAHVNKLTNEFGRFTHVSAEFAKALGHIFFTLFHNSIVCNCALFINAS
jgi:hypothetical protein